MYNVLYASVIGAVYRVVTVKLLPLLGLFPLSFQPIFYAFEYFRSERLAKPLFIFSSEGHRRKASPYTYVWPHELDKAILKPLQVLKSNVFNCTINQRLTVYYYYIGPNIRLSFNHINIQHWCTICKNAITLYEHKFRENRPHSANFRHPLPFQIAREFQE